MNVIPPLWLRHTGPVWPSVDVGRDIGRVGWDSGCPVGKDAATGKAGPGPSRAERDAQLGWQLTSGGASGKQGHKGSTTWAVEWPESDRALGGIPA